MKTNRINLYSILILFICISSSTSCKYFQRIHHNYSQSNIDKIKYRIAHFEDNSLNNRDVTLVKFDNYYIGFAKYQNQAYFLAYISPNDSVKVIRIFNKKWESDLKINESIISANNLLDSVKLCFDTIDGKEGSDSLVFTIETNSHEPHSIWGLKTISDVQIFSRYILKKCYVDCPKNLADLFKTTQ